jgi:hypothetical protein
MVTIIAVDFQATVLGRGADVTPIVNNTKVHAISGKTDMEMPGVQYPKLDDIGRNEQRASNTREGDTHLGLNGDEEDVTYHETAVPDTQRLDINTIEAVSFQLKDLPI